MSSENKHRVCPVELAGSLDSYLRKLLQNPRKILEPFIRPGMTVLDIGCGPGFFTIEIAGMLNGSGKVIAADLQEGMLAKVKAKITGTPLEKLITLHKCESDKVGVTSMVDFVLAFYVVHEVPDQERFFKELKSIIKPGGRIYIIEPDFHVSRKSFEKMVNNLVETGFKIIARPKVLISRAVLVQML